MSRRCVSSSCLRTSERARPRFCSVICALKASMPPDWLYRGGLPPVMMSGRYFSASSAHVTTWEEEALKYLPLIITGGRPPRYIQYGGIDAFNAQMTEQKRGLALSDVLRQLDETHRRLIDYIRSVPEEHFSRETRFRRRLRLDTYSHYPQHAKAIREWRGRPADKRNSGRGRGSLLGLFSPPFLSPQ